MKKLSSILLLGLGLSECAFAFSPDFHLGMEGDFSRDVVTPSSFPFLRVGADASDENYQMDFELKMSAVHPQANAFSAKNIYYETNSTESPLRISFGRKLVEWSDLDESWGLGQYNTLDSWDRLRSFSQGLTGIFLSYDEGNVQTNFFASYLMLPEITPNVVIDNHHFDFYHPQSVSAGPQTFQLLNRSTPLGYNLLVPSLSKILFRPSIVLSMNSKKTLDPFFVKLSAGYLPLNYFPVALQASLAIPIDQIVVDLRPRLLSHALYNADLDYAFNDDTKTGFSVLIDHIYSEDTLPSDYTTAPLSTTTYYSPWVKWNDFKFSYIYSQGGIAPDVGPYANTAHNLFSSRILYRNAAQVQYNYSEVTAKVLHEFSINANWIALDWKHAWTKNFSSIVGGDVISAEKDAADGGGAEFLSDLRAIDRIRLGVNYVF